MKQAILLLLTILIVAAGFTSCRITERPYNSYRIPEHRTRHHWGAPRHNSIRSRYWGVHRYGPRPHSERGRQRY